MVGTESRKEGRDMGYPADACLQQRAGIGGDHHLDVLVRLAPARVLPTVEEPQGAIWHRPQHPVHSLQVCRVERVRLGLKSPRHNNRVVRHHVELV